MSVKICGHKIRWQKPIKIYSLLKTVALLMVINLIAIAPAFAAEPSSLLRTNKASSGSAVPCLPLLKSGMATNVPHEKGIAPIRAQRTAGSPSMSPAVALALALGVRNVSGPMVRTAHHARTTPPSLPLEQQALLLPRDKGCAPALSANIFQPRMAMEK